jgi:hypothetical protein
MNKLFQKPLNVFMISVMISFLLFFLIPLNLFEGEIVFQEGANIWKQKANISLSYFVGIGADKESLTKIGVKDFYLLPKGYILAIIVLVGLPALIAFRNKIKNRKVTQ